MRLRQVLPADVADRVLARIAEARARELPAVALEQRALKFAAKGVAPADIERSVVEQLGRMARAKAALEEARRAQLEPDEIDAGAEAIRQGVDGAAVSALARSAPSGRSLAVPLYVVGSLVARGLPSDEALAKVQERLAAHATDAELEALPDPSDAGHANRPAAVGGELAATKRPGAVGGAPGARPAGGPPAGVPANPGGRARPTPPARPLTPERPGKP